MSGNERVRLFLKDDRGRTLVDLCSDSPGFFPMRVRHEPASTRGRVMTTLSLVSVDGVAGVRMRAREVLREALVMAAREVGRANRPNWVWLEMSEPDEMPRRGLVYGGVITEPGDGFIGEPTQVNRNVSRIDVVIERGAWEATEPTVLPVATIAEQGGVVVLPAMGAGRIGRLRLGPLDYSSGFQSLSMMAVGMRSDGGRVENFDARIPVGVTYVFVGSSEVTLTSFKLGDKFSGDLSCYQGRWRVYAQLTTTSLTLATLAVGVSGNFAPYVDMQPPVFVESSTNGMYLGTIDLPFAGFEVAAESDVIGESTIVLKSKMLDGTVGVSSLEVVALVLVPDEMWLESTEFYITSTVAGAHNQQEIFTAPDGRRSNRSIDPSEQSVYRHSAINGSEVFEYPADGGMLVICHAVRNTYDVEVEIEVWSRFDAYRV